MLRATATKLYRSLLSTTSVAYQLENDTFNNFNAGGYILNVNGVPDLAALAPTSLSVGSTSNVERTTDYMVSQSFNLKDRYIVRWTVSPRRIVAVRPQRAVVQLLSDIGCVPHHAGFPHPGLPGVEGARGQGNGRPASDL